MKQDADWVTISESIDPSLLFKLIKKFALKKSNNQYKTAVLIAEQLLILLFRQDDQISNAVCYDCFTTRVEVACQAGVCYYSLELLEDKAAQIKMGNYDTLADTNKKTIEQEYLAYLFLNNSNRKMHSQLKKDVANDYSKGNTDPYPTDIHKALTLMNEYKPLKLDTQVIPAQGTAFVTGGQGGKKKGKGSKKYLKEAVWNALSPEAQSKIIEPNKKSENADLEDKSLASNKSAKTINSLSKRMKLLEKNNHRLKKLVSML
jgi:hypothetical protein